MKDKGQMIGEWMIGIFGGIVAMSIIYKIMALAVYAVGVAVTLDLFVTLLRYLSHG